MEDYSLNQQSIMTDYKEDKASKNLVRQTYQILSDALYSMEIYRNIFYFFERKRNLSLPDEDEFWAHIANDCIQMGVIQWTKVFGSDHNNRTHYTNWISQEMMVQRLSEKQIDAKTVLVEMTDFRNHYVAHRDTVRGEDNRVPYLDGAMRTIYEFDKAMIEKPGMEWISEELGNLEDWHEAFRLRIKDYLEHFSKLKTSLLFGE